MVCQYKDEMLQVRQDNPQRPIATKHVTLFILLGVRQVNHLSDLGPGVEVKTYWAADLDGAQQHAQTMLRQDSRLDHVSVLDGQGQGVLGVANRTESTVWAESVPSADQFWLRSRSGFH